MLTARLSFAVVAQAARVALQSRGIATTVVKRQSAALHSISTWHGDAGQWPQASSCGVKAWSAYGSAVGSARWCSSSTASGFSVFEKAKQELKVDDIGGPTSESYAKVVRTCIGSFASRRAGGLPADRLQLAVDLLREAGAAGGDVAADKKTYNSVITACSIAVKAGQGDALQLAVDVLKEAGKVGGDAAPDKIMYTAVIKACTRAVKAGNVDAWLLAVDLLRESGEVGGDAAPDKIGYTNVIKTCAQAVVAGNVDAWRRAVDLLREAGEAGGDAAPDKLMYKEVHRACARAASRGVREAETVRESLMLEMSQLS